MFRPLRIFSSSYNPHRARQVTLCFWLGRSLRVGAVTGSGLVVAGGAADYEIVGFDPLVVAAADGYEAPSIMSIGDVGGVIVAVPFPDVVEFASVHGGSAFEAAAVADGHCEALGGLAG